MPDLTELAAEIERLDAEASLGPWHVGNMEWNGTHGVEWLSSETRQSIADCSENVAITEHGFCGRVELAEIKANAALIALLRNNVTPIVAALRAASRVERVEAALRPFAEACPEYLDDEDADDSIIADFWHPSVVKLKITHLMAARRALGPAP